MLSLQRKTQQILNIKSKNLKKDTQDLTILLINNINRRTLSLVPYKRRTEKLSQVVSKFAN